MSGGTGYDILEPDNGADIAIAIAGAGAGAGDDQVTMPADGKRDVVRCAKGNDLANGKVDKFDKFKNCERFAGNDY